MRRTKILISIAILLIIGLHAVPVLHAGARKTLWPFLAWSMYNRSRPPGPVVAYKRRIVGVTSRGEREEVTTELLGLSITALTKLYVAPMWTADSSAARQLMDRLNRGRVDPFVELRLESETYTVTDDGIARKDNPVITYRATF